MKNNIIISVIILLMTPVLQAKTTVGGYPASTSLEIFNKACEYIMQEDSIALKRLLDSGSVIILKSGIDVEVVKVKLFSGAVKIRPRGTTIEIWTNIEAVKDTEISSAKIPDIKALLDDADFLEKLYYKVRSKDYIPTKEASSNIVSEINKRFNMKWMENRGVLPRSKNEAKIMDAARTLMATCASIVMEFACTSPEDLKKEYWPSVVNDYDRDFLQFLNELRVECKAY